jgi:hypothetical protein
MPFRNYTQFDSTTLKVMQAAYDAVLVRLGVTADNPLTGKIAAKIAELALEGERDVKRLEERALSGVQ